MATYTLEAYRQFLSERAREGGFIRDVDLPAIVELDRLRPLLVRCGARRFVAPAQDVAGMIAAIEAAGDYVRDVSFPAGDAIFRGDFRPIPTTVAATRPARTAAATRRPAGFTPTYGGGDFEHSDADPGL